MTIMLSRRDALGLAASGLALIAPGSAQAAPGLVVRDLNGGTFNLAARRGRVALVNFWATWCPPCREEMPALSRFYSRHAGHGLDMIAVSVDKPRDIDAVRRMAGQVSFRVALIGEASENGFGKPGGLPVTYVIDRAGDIAAEMRPDSTPINDASLAATILPLLKRV